RTVVVDLVRLALVGGRIPWFAVSPGSISSPVPSTTPAALPIGTTLYTYRGHSGVVWSVAWSLDSKRIASGSFDGTVQVWDAADGSNVYTYRGHSSLVDTIAWSPDGKRIASGGVKYDKTVQV